VCAGEERPPPGSGNAATRSVASPPSPRTTRPGCPCAAKRAGSRKVREADANQGNGHQPTLGGVARGELADRAHESVKMRRLNGCGNRPAADEQQRCGNRGNQTPPRHATHGRTVRPRPAGRVGSWSRSCEHGRSLGSVQRRCRKAVARAGSGGRRHGGVGADSLA
jgi:hypothetical protein